MDNNDIELFSTTDLKAKDKIVSILVRHRVSYLERWEKVPLLKRREYGGAKELCVIYVNGNQYEKARKILDEFNKSYASARKARRKRRTGEESLQQVPQMQEQGMDEQYGQEEQYSQEAQQGVMGSTGYEVDDIDDGIDDI